MPRINLLPLRAAQRRDTALRELYAIVGIVLLTVVGLYAWYGSSDSDMEDLNNRIGQVNRDIGKLEKDVVKVKDIERKTKTVQQKRKVIAQLEANRTGPSRMLSDLATILTQEPKVWLTAIKESKGSITLAGDAMEHENISDFQIALQQQSKFFTDVQLSVVKATTIDKGKNSPQVLQWVITCKAVYPAG